jgi:hypothetical protein
VEQAAVLFCGSVRGRAVGVSGRCADLWFCEWEGRLGVSGRCADLWFCEWEGRLEFKAAVLISGSVSGRAG